MVIDQSPPYWPQAIAELSESDPVMKKLIAHYPGESIESRKDPFLTLMRSITGQQISTKASAAIWGRLEDNLSHRERSKSLISGEGVTQPSPASADASATSPHGRGKMTPQAIATLTPDTLRSIGYSRMKVSYLHSLAEFFMQRQHLERDWAEMSDEEVIKDITQIKGIGVWTAEMFLMFHLLRPNVLPLGDIGLVNGIAKFYNGGEKLKPAQMREVASKWQPWCSAATWYLWRSCDDEAVAY